jgi:Tetratricopeptide repeat
MSNLAWAFKLDGQFAEAEKLNRQCLAIRSRVLGPGNEATSVSLFNLAEVLWLEGQSCSQCTNCCVGTTTRKLNEKASLHEGHGFSRAVNAFA